jgi:phosphopantothenoylcysteine decarboxylase/phosphopantothenate--cysteine ligase
MLRDKRILVGICGGIAAYKAAELVSRLKKKGALIKVVMTKNATEFISPVTLQTLSQERVALDMFDFSQSREIEHISLAKWAEYIVVAPATANFIGKIAAGIADDLLTTTVMASKAEAIIAPAMNTNMYSNSTVQQNIDSLARKGYRFVGPVKGALACGDAGMGKMEEPQVIVEYLEGMTDRQQDLCGKTVLVTAGPTREVLDPVRFFTNASTGRMGYSVAAAAAQRGAKVYLISGPTHLQPPPLVEFKPVTSAVDMYNAVMEVFPDCDIVIKTAAVSDYRPSEVYQQKVKKIEDRLTVNLIRNPDILKELAKKKGKRILVGFAAESTNIEEYAGSKLEEKNLDLIVANDITQEGAGFGSETNQGLIMDRKGNKEYLPIMSKEQMSDIILDKAASLIKDT